MISNPKEEISVVTKNEEIIKKSKASREFPANLPAPDYKMEPWWHTIIVIVTCHILCLVGLFFRSKLATKAFATFYGIMGGFGVTAGAHRLFCHKSYKANKKLKILLLYLQSISYQYSAYEWSRDHRIHHTYTDTNADPHNIRRGFFFSHIGWLFCQKHPDYFKFGSRVSLSDLEADPYIMFQHKYYYPIMILTSIVIPVFIPWYFWNETFWGSFFDAFAFRYLFIHHITYLVNSAAHTYGMKPFDKHISSTDNYLVGFLALGEGWHNYHHVFPYDYKTSELGFYTFNLTTAFIDFFAWIGWASELKTVSADMIRKRVCRTGDGSHKYSKESDETLLKAFVLQKSIDENGNMIHGSEELVWGYDDEMMTEEEKKNIMIL